MISTRQLQLVLDGGGTVTDESGATIGEIDQIYWDGESGYPEWVTTKPGLSGQSETLVPLKGASVDGLRIQIARSGASIQDGRRVDAGQQPDTYR